MEAKRVNYELLQRSAAKIRKDLGFRHDQKVQTRLKEEDPREIASLISIPEDLSLIKSFEAIHDVNRKPLEEFGHELGNALDKLFRLVKKKDQASGVLISLPLAERGAALINLISGQMPSIQWIADGVNFSINQGYDKKTSISEDNISTMVQKDRFNPVYNSLPAYKDLVVLEALEGEALRVKMQETNLAVQKVMNKCKEDLLDCLKEEYGDEQAESVLEKISPHYFMQKNIASDDGEDKFAIEFYLNLDNSIETMTILDDEARFTANKPTVERFE